MIRRILVALFLTAGAMTAASASPADAAPSRCAWLAPHLASVGLPVQTFLNIAYRESGCSRTGVRVADRDDLSTSRFGLNFKGTGMQRYWRNLCGATHWTQMANLSWDLKCTKAAYRQLGLRPWR